MGYRSEVIFGVRKKHEKKLEKVLKKHDMSLWFDSVERNHEYQEDGKWI